MCEVNPTGHRLPEFVEDQTNAVSHTICGLCVPRRRFPVVSLSLRLKRESELRDCSCVLTVVGSPGPNLNPGTTGVCGMHGWGNGLNTTHTHRPRVLGQDLTVRSIFKAVSQPGNYVYTYRPRFQVRARPSYSTPGNPFMYHDRVCFVSVG